MFVVKLDTQEGDNLYLTMIVEGQWRAEYGLADALKWDTREQAEAALSINLDPRRHGYEIAELHL